MARAGRQKERERRAVNAMVRWGPGCAYLPVILHVVAQADEAGLEFLWPQRPAVVLPVSEGRCARGGVETRPHRGGERGQGYMQRAGGGEHMEEGNTELEVMWTRTLGQMEGCEWPGGQSEAPPTSLGPEQGGELSGKELRIEYQDSEGGESTPCLQGLGWQKRDCTPSCVRHQGPCLTVQGRGCTLLPTGGRRAMTHQAQQ